MKSIITAVNFQVEKRICLKILTWDVLAEVANVLSIQLFWTNLEANSPNWPLTIMAPGLISISAQHN